MKTAGAIVLGAASGALAGVLVLGAWILTRPDMAPEGRQVQQAEEMPETSAALGSPVTASALAADEGIPVVASGSVDPVDPTQYIDPVRVKQEATREHEARWTTDAAAPAQASQLEQQLLSVAATEGVSSAHFQPTRLNAQCKASMCRIESDYAAGEDGSEWATRMLIGMAGTFGHSQMLSEPLPGGGQRLVMYAYRAGHNPRQ